MRYISFAQEYEDIILYSALRKYVQKGFYVDIGANDPCVLSVTKLFYDMGWRGINIEPLDDMYQLLCVERQEDRNLNVGISDENGELELFVSGDMSSFCDINGAQSKVIKQVRKFSDIWKEINYKKRVDEVHFCKIDVEGFERNVIKGMDFETFRPWIFCIESTLPGTMTPCHDTWEEILLSKGYLWAFQYGINRYYVEREKEFLTEGLINFKCMFKDNEIWRVSYINNYLLNKRWLDKHKNFVLFGSGYFMRNFDDMYGTKYKPLAIVDNSKRKQGMMMLGKIVASPDILREYKDVAVLICCRNSGEIIEQLEEMGIKNYKNYNYVKML